VPASLRAGRPSNTDATALPAHDGGHPITIVVADDTTFVEHLGNAGRPHAAINRPIASLHRPSGWSRSFVLASLRALHLDQHLRPGALRAKRALTAAPHTGNAGLAAVIRQFLGDHDDFGALALPFAAVTLDTATGRAHPIRQGPLLPALLASAAVPGIYPPVDHDGRHLYDGGIVANVPMRIAVDMGARSLVVLDCSYPGQLPSPGETLAEIVLFTTTVTMRSQAVHEAPLVAQDIPVVYLPGPTPRLVSPLDFSHSDELIEASYEAARPFLASLTITGPGLYGSPEA
jgi:NTE family protein